ncbi:MAG: hypothetical protein ABL921_05900 [Pirellula sp.]
MDQEDAMEGSRDFEVDRLLFLLANVSQEGLLASSLPSDLVN